MYSGIKLVLDLSCCESVVEPACHDAWGVLFMLRGQDLPWQFGKVHTVLLHLAQVGGSHTEFVSTPTQWFQTC